MANFYNREMVTSFTTQECISTSLGVKDNHALLTPHDVSPNPHNQRFTHQWLALTKGHILKKHTVPCFVKKKRRKYFKIP